MVRSPRSTASRLPLPTPNPSAPPPVACVYSTAVEGDISRLLGRPHYSYRFAEAKFLEMFSSGGLPPQLIRMPEYYATREAIGERLGPDARAPLVHLIFRSTEQIRVLHPGYNIACYAWEFEVMRDWTPPGHHPFLDQRRMLSLCEEVWVPCRFTRDVLIGHGLENVHVIPAPLSMPSHPRLGRAEALAMVGHVAVMPLRYNFLMSNFDNARAVAAQSRSLMDWLYPKSARPSEPIIYLAVLNPDDFRKNIDSLLRGFHYFQRSHPRAVLIIKALTAPDRRLLDRIIAELVPNKLDAGSVFDNPGIVLFAHYLSGAQMRALYCLADFYVSASMAEGQNLPLLEAMAEGTVAVSTATTAMADYITPSNAFVIASARRDPQSEHLAGSVARRPYQVDFSRPQDVHDALMRSAAARPPELRAKAAAGIATVRSQYSTDAVWPAIRARLAAIAADAAETAAAA